MKPVILTGDLNVAHRNIDCEDAEKKGRRECLTEEERSGFDDIISAGVRDLWRDQNPGVI